MQLFFYIKQFFKFYFTAQTLYHIHSPFVYEFCEKILEDDRHFYAFSEIETFRELLKTNSSKISDSSNFSIAQLTKSSENNWLTYRLLFRIVQHFQLKNILEVGTSMGISTLYLSEAAKDGVIVSFCQNSDFQNQLNRNFQRMKVENIEVHFGNFDSKIKDHLSNFKSFDCILIKENFEEISFQNYFSKIHENSVIIFLNPYKSIKNKKTWEKIKAHKTVKLSIDLFFMGLLFFRKEQRTKVHFSLIKSTWKPFGIGLRDLLRG